MYSPAMAVLMSSSCPSPTPSGPGSSEDVRTVSSCPRWDEQSNWMAGRLSSVTVCSS